MKKYTDLVVVGVVVALCAGTLHAQGIESSPGTRVGVGVALERTLASVLFGGGEDRLVGLSNIYVPIVTASGFRVEPEIGYARYSESSGDDWKSSASSLRIGLGILPATQRGNTSIYYGARFGLVYTATSTEAIGFDESESKTDYYVGAVIGGEYTVSMHFGVGAEVQINYVAVGDFEEASDDSVSAIGNRNLILVRWYF
jgi:hypothetical protein